jgi:hypothetical protein
MLKQEYIIIIIIIIYLHATMTRVGQGKQLEDKKMLQKY